MNRPHEPPAPRDFPQPAAEKDGAAGDEDAFAAQFIPQAFGVA
jgi:hypothetical protein